MAETIVTQELAIRAAIENIADENTLLVKDSRSGRTYEQLYLGSNLFIDEISGDLFLNSQESGFTPDRALVSNGSGNIAVSAVTSTELEYLSGTTSNIQTQLNGKQDTITGAATTIVSADLTVDRAVISNGSGKIAVSSVTSTELGYLSGATSNIQDQINAISGSDVFGSGTQHYIPKWSASDTLSNSIIYETGSNIGIGTTTPVTKTEILNGSYSNTILLVRGVDSAEHISVGVQDDYCLLTAGTTASDNVDLVIRTAASGISTEKMRVASNGTISIVTCANAGTDTDKFLVLDGSNNINHRTGTQVLSDIEALSGSLSSQFIPVANGAASLTDSIIYQSSGRIGIDVYPLATLHINGDLRIATVVNAGTDTDKFLVLDASGDVDYRTGAEVLSDIGAALSLVTNYIPKAASSTTLGNSVVYQDGTNVVIGTTSADAKLHVFAGNAGAITPSTSADDFIVENDSTCGMSIMNPNGNSGNIYFASPSNDDNVRLWGHYNSGSPYFGIAIDGTEVARFFNSNVGISKTIPAVKFHIESTGADNFLRVSDSANNSEANFGCSSGNGGVLFLKDTSGAAKAFFSSYGDSYLLAGKLGIGTDNPTAPYDLHITARTSPSIRFTDTTTNTHCDILGSDGDLDLHADRTSQGTTSYITFNIHSTEHARFEQDGGFFAFNLATDTGTDLIVNGSNEICKKSSARRFKTNICPTSIDSSILQKFKAVDFTWKKNSMRDIGFIADDLAMMFPGIETYSKGEIQSWDTQKMLVLAVMEIQRLQKEINQLKSVA